MLSDSYEATVRRVTILAVAIGIAGLAITFIGFGPRAGGGFLVGAVLSAVNFELWKRLVGALGSSGQKPRGGSAVVLGARYLIAGGIIYVTIRVFGITLGAVFVGLLVSLAAIILEFIYELAFLNH